MTAIAQALSAALLHFIWQGALVAVMLWIALMLLRNRSASERYCVSCAAMGLMAALPAVTLWMSYRGFVPAAISASISTALAAPIEGARMAPEAPWIALWRQWALPAWSAGVFVFALRLAWGCRDVTVLRRHSRAADGSIVEIVSRLARRMKASQTIRVLMSDASESPSVVGWLRPAILLPAAALAGLEHWQLEAVLAHEIAHIRRHDYLVNLMQTLVEALLFYHPAVWWVSARMRHERELCCDDAAVAICGDAIGYARALTSLERLRVAPPRLALGSAGGSLLRRIERLAGMKRDVGPSKLPGIAALALGVACFATTLHWANAQQTASALQQLPNEWGITVSSTGDLQHRTRVVYPRAALKTEGTVKLQVTLDQTGNVADAMVMSGPADLRKAALQSALQWQYANGHAGETQQVSIAFQKDPRAAFKVDLDEQARMLITKELREQEAELAAKEKQLKSAEKMHAQLREFSIQEQDKELAAEGKQLKVLGRQLEADRMKQQLADLQTRDTDSHPDVVQQKLKIEALENKIREEKVNATYEAKSKQTSSTQKQKAELAAEQERLMVLAQELQSERMKQNLADLQSRDTDSHPDVVQQKLKIEALQEKLNAAYEAMQKNTSSTYAFRGATLSRIEVRGLSDSSRMALTETLPIHIGETLSAQDIDKATFTVTAFDERLRCQFLRAEDGTAVLQIDGPTAFYEIRK